MIELLALPSWNCPPRSLDDWRAALSSQGHEAAVRRDDGETWLEVAALRVRGFVVFEGTRLDAINFELHDPAREEALPALEAAVQSLSWELYPEDVEADDLDED
jgi:hypothetical protein